MSTTVGFNPQVGFSSKSSILSTVKNNAGTAEQLANAYKVDIAGVQLPQATMRGKNEALLNIKAAFFTMLRETVSFVKESAVKLLK